MSDDVKLKHAVEWLRSVGQAGPWRDEASIILAHLDAELARQGEAVVKALTDFANSHAMAVRKAREEQREADVRNFEATLKECGEDATRVDLVARPVGGQRRKSRRVASTPSCGRQRRV